MRHRHPHRHPIGPVRVHRVGVLIGPARARRLRGDPIARPRERGTLVEAHRHAHDIRRIRFQRDRRIAPFQNDLLLRAGAAGNEQHEDKNPRSPSIHRPCFRSVAFNFMVTSAARQSTPGMKTCTAAKPSSPYINRFAMNSILAIPTAGCPILLRPLLAQSGWASRKARSRFLHPAPALCMMKKACPENISRTALHPMAA